MEEVLPGIQGQRDSSKMPQCWVPPDERDAYIGWLKGEFAAANAIIDSMCHHVRSIGDPGEYDMVFGCLNRRRQAWTSSLYMQQFFSVAEIVSSLQDVAWKKHQTHRSSSFANAPPKACTSNQAQAEEGHDKIQLERNQKSNSNLQQYRQLTSKWHQAQEGTSDLEGLVEKKCLSTSKDVNGSPVRAASPETGEVEGPCLLNHTLSESTEFDMIECDKRACSNENGASATTHACNSGEKYTCANHTTEQANDQASLLDSKGLDARELLNIEVSIALNEEDDRHMMIERSMQFQCCERVGGQMIDDGESVELCESVFSRKEVDDIIEIVYQLQAAGRRGQLGCAFTSCNKSGSHVPDVIQFGPRLSDGPGAMTNDYHCIPKFLHSVINWLTRCGILSAKRRPDSCLISIFDEGDFEPPNTDQGAWEKPLCVISLMGDCTMVFGHSLSTDQQGNCKGPFEVGLPAGSVLLLHENFAGILQKAIPASWSRRITVAMGKAIFNTTRIAAEGSCLTVVGKAKMKQWGTGAHQNGRTSPLPIIDNGMPPKQSRLASSNPGVMSVHHIIPHHHHHQQYPFPSIQPLLPSYPPTGGFLNPYMPHSAMLQGSWSPAPAKLHSSSAGTGVFFPSTCELNAGAGPTWQSGLIVLSSVTPPTALDVRRSVQAKRAEKHAAGSHLRVEGSSFDSLPRQSKLTSVPALPRPTSGCGAIS